MVTLQIQHVLKETPSEAVVELWCILVREDKAQDRHAELQWQEKKR